MGNAVSDFARENGIAIVAGVDRRNEVSREYPVFERLEMCPIQADVVVDFSTPEAVEELLRECCLRKLPLVLCTTGFTEQQKNLIRTASKEIPLLWSANMSLGVNLLGKLVKEAAEKLLPVGFDVEILEKHHRWKKDAPSGTAIFFVNSVDEALEYKHKCIYNRNNSQKRREKNEIGIASIRGGTITGEHDIIFAGEDEVVTFSHAAFSRRVFAKGALEAAGFLIGRPPGLYCMEEVIGDL